MQWTKSLLGGGLVAVVLTITGCPHPVSETEYQQLLARVQMLEDTLQVHREISKEWAQKVKDLLDCGPNIVNTVPAPPKCPAGGNPDDPPPVKPGW